MKTRRTIYMITGTVLLAINLLVNLGGSRDRDPSQHGLAYNIGQIIGTYIFAVLGLIFLWMGYRIHKKIAADEEDIDDIGKNS